MIVVFRRTGQRRYAIEARREEFPDVEMNPAPGYDARMPHDLVHLVVESQLGLTGGVFGQLAAGGNAGTFHPILRPLPKARTASRIRNRLQRRGNKLRRDGRDDAALSERAAFICFHEWLGRLQSNRPPTVGRSQKQNESAFDPKPLLTERKLEEICRHLDDLSSCWSRLEIGQSIAIRWPDLTLAANRE